MSRSAGRVLAATLAVGLVLALGSAALAAPVGTLKQFKVPTANSQPRAITNGPDGNRWFTEGTEFTSAPAKIARITPAGVITEFAPGVAAPANRSFSYWGPSARLARKPIPAGGTANFQLNSGSL